jgi:hypothetical protein
MLGIVYKPSLYVIKAMGIHHSTATALLAAAAAAAAAAAFQARGAPHGARVGSHV